MMSTNKYDPDLVKAIIDKIANMSPEQIAEMKGLLGITEDQLTDCTKQKSD